jgi:hypothetical protein
MKKKATICSKKKNKYFGKNLIKIQKILKNTKKDLK